MYVSKNVYKYQVNAEYRKRKKKEQTNSYYIVSVMCYTFFYMKYADDILSSVNLLVFNSRNSPFIYMYLSYDNDEDNRQYI